MHVLPYNIGDWDGLDQFQAYLSGMTANLVPFGIEMMQGGPLAAKLFGLNYAVGRQPLRPGQVEVFHSASGLNVYRNPEAFPRVWTVHQLSSTTSRDLISRLESADLRREVALTGPGPKLNECGKGDVIKLLRREATHIVIEARMACEGMVILSRLTIQVGKLRLTRIPGIFEAYGALQGIVADAGTNRIELRYRPFTVYWGASLTALGLGAALVIAMAGRKRENAALVSSLGASTGKL
jgi:hypothetical protein